MRALELDCDNLIIGGGLAGLTAALRLPGNVILLSNGYGATAVSGGVFCPSGGDPEAEEWFLSTMAGAYARGKCRTVSGTPRSGIVPASTAFEGSPVPVTINEERPGFRHIEFMPGCSHQEIARILDNDDGAIDALSGVFSTIGGDCLLIPPVLGIEHTAEVRDRICRSAGLDVYEYVTAPSVLGLRLIHALRRKAAASERLRMLEVVEARRIVDGRVEGLMGTKGKRSIRISTSNLFIATGGPMTGFTTAGDRMFEPLTGATVTRDFEADLDEHFFSKHPLMYKGIEPEPYVHGFTNVRAIGAVSRGFGLYEALVSGYHAGDGLE